MPINPDAVGSVGEPARHSWDERDVMLYALGVGAGLDDLALTTENTSGVDLTVLPSMAVILGGGGGNALSGIGTFNPVMLVHGGQSFRVHGSIPTSGVVSTVGEVTAIWDKGSGAVVEFTSTTKLEGSDDVLFSQVTSIFLRGEGGFGGERGPSGPQNVPPDHAADDQIVLSTREDQALLYRLSGDHNPLHSDPSFAAAAGFDRPILHGLCTYGFTCRGLITALCDGDPTRLSSMDGRFSSPVYPGETLTVRVWRSGDGEAVFTTHGSDDRVVISAGHTTWRD
ncbi:MAG: MaoC family dehydratase N-terminal domain-containing protein [Actinobacteria bacterium]|nr:MaoC family dehydratase N-terminal domain-containing protein [Actinomycetota bacterium]